MTLRVRGRALMSIDIRTEQIRDFTQTGNRCSFIAGHARSAVDVTTTTFLTTRKRGEASVYRTHSFNPLLTVAPARALSKFNVPQ